MYISVLREGILPDIQNVVGIIKQITLANIYGVICALEILLVYFFTFILFNMFL
jgi:hypothetical protein